MKKYSKITDQTGQVAQTLAYLPYGEDWVDVTAFMYDTSQIGFYQFNGKEKDPETDYLYYGARYHWPDVWNGWLSPDPLMDEYLSISPYAYCNWNPVNLVDPDGMETNPIYDLSGNFLGTDDRGLQGDPIIMEKNKFSQNMSHADAIKAEANFADLVTFCNSEGFSSFIKHSNTLSSRPDWDGVITREEGIAWAKSHLGALEQPTPDNTLYINSALLDFGNICTSDFANGVEKVSPIQTLTLGNFVKGLQKGKLQNTVYALGRVDVLLLNESGDVQIINNKATDYDWNFGGGFMRNSMIWMERGFNGLSSEHGFKTIYYGTGRVKK